MTDVMFIEALDNEIEGIWVTDGFKVACRLHGDIKHFPWDSGKIPWPVIEEVIDEHVHSFHTWSN